MEISFRLKEIAKMVTPKLRVCDVGCDHGYLSIYLMQQNIATKVIAMDVAKGPLSKAVENISKEGLEKVIQTRLSDGIKELGDDEVDAIVIAGMGGMLMSRLLKDSIEKFRKSKELILSPHTEIELVRKELMDNDFVIVDEKMLIDEGKYYVVIKAQPGKHTEYTTVELLYGPSLLSSKDTVLKRYLQKEYIKLVGIKENLKIHNTDNAQQRILQLEGELALIEEGLRLYEM